MPVTSGKENKMAAWSLAPPSGGNEMYNQRHFLFQGTNKLFNLDHNVISKVSTVILY